MAMETIAEEISSNKRFFNKVASYYDFLLKRIIKKVQKRAIETAGIQKIPNRNFLSLQICHNKPPNINTDLKIDKTSKGSLLDVGFGTGNLFLLLKNTKLKLFGIDISQKMLKIAKEKLKKENIKANLKILAVENLKEKNKYDFIFCTEAFHHFSNKEKALENMKNALKKNGVLIIADINFYFLNYLFHLIEPGNTGILSAKKFVFLFKKFNFKNIKQEKMPFTILTRGEK